MSLLARYPTIYEINTWVWLSELSEKYGTVVDLGCVPAAEWDALEGFGFDAVWFMGVWERSPAGTAIANGNQGLLEDFRRALPDFRPEDNVGSPYCVRRYVVDQNLGGPEGLALARAELSKRGVRLILDFVPNHVAPDHPWTTEHREYFVQGTPEDAKNDPASFLVVGDNVFACGRDPYFPAWPDVLQLNAFSSGLRVAVVETIDSIALQCDGIRCDMAMLLLNSIFERTWGARAGAKPETDYWLVVIDNTKRSHPDFRFIAEAYWDMEWQLQQQGFDFCYDKRLLDRLEHDLPDSVRWHLCADLDYQDKLVRFIENHDEPRAAATFPAEREKAAAVAMATLPGARLFHEGQFEGRKVRVPVFLGRRPFEPVNEELQTFYTKLLRSIDHPIFRDGQWNLCERTGWPDNQSYLNLMAWNWVNDNHRRLIVVNLSQTPVQARVRVPWGGGNCILTDQFSGASYERSGDEMQGEGLYVGLAPWEFHFFECHAVRADAAVR
jgi:hypothetical protein